MLQHMLITVYCIIVTMMVFCICVYDTVCTFYISIYLWKKLFLINFDSSCSFLFPICVIMVVVSICLKYKTDFSSSVA